MPNINQIRETIYHEFGHALVYLLSYESHTTNLGIIEKISIGYKNFVSPKHNLYYYEPLIGNTKHITENSQNIARSICWIILQISGCIFESEYEQKNFEQYFCSKYDCSGKKDSDNLFYFRKYSIFKINDEDISRIRINYTNLLYKHSTFFRTEQYLEYFLDIHQGSTHINLDEEEIEVLLCEMKDKIITTDLITDFFSMLEIEARNYIVY